MLFHRSEKNARKAEPEAPVCALIDLANVVGNLWVNHSRRHYPRVRLDLQENAQGEANAPLQSVRLARSASCLFAAALNRCRIRAS